MATRKPLASPRITVTDQSKRTVEFPTEHLPYYLIADNMNGRPMVRLSDDPEYEDAYINIERDDFLDAVVALFPDNVAYKFHDEDDDA